MNCDAQVLAHLGDRGRRAQVVGGVAQMAQGAGEVAFEDVSFGYQKERPVLMNINPPSTFTDKTTG